MTLNSMPKITAQRKGVQGLLLLLSDTESEIYRVDLYSLSPIDLGMSSDPSHTDCNDNLT